MLGAIVFVLASAVQAREGVDAAEQSELCRNPAGYAVAEQQYAACDALLRQSGLSRRLQTQFLIGRGEALRELKQPTRALEDFRKAAELQPDNADAWYGQASIEADRNAFPVAQAALDRVLALDDHHFRGLILRGWVRQRQGDVEAARSDYETARQQNPEQSAPLTGLGELHLLAGDHAAAIELFTAALKLNRYSSNALLLRARTYIAIDEPELALPDAEQLIAAYPGHAMGYDLRAELHQIRGHNEWALQDYDRALLIDPARPAALANRGLIKQRTGDAYGGLHDIDRALAIDRNDAALHVTRARMLMAMRRSGEALAAVEKAVQLAPRYGDALRLRAQLQMNYGRSELAIADAERAVDLAATVEDKVAALATRAFVNEKLGVLDLAADDLDKAIGLGVRRPSLHLWRARLLLQIDDIPGMQADLDAVSNISQAKSELAEAQIIAGLAEARAGRYEGAIGHYGKAIALDAAYADAWLERGNAQFSIGDFPAALADYRQAVTLEPQSYTALGNLCLTLMTMERLVDALAECDAALRLERNNAALFNKRGIVLLRLERAADALRDFQRAIEIDANNVVAFYGRGLARLRLGQAADGRADLAHASGRDATIAAEYRKWKLTP